MTMNENDKQAEPVAWESALEFAAQTIELYDDATMKNDYMLDASECAAIIRASKPMHPAQPVQPPADVVRELVEALKKAQRELDACQKVLWLIELDGDGVDPAYGSGARVALVEIGAALKSAKEHGL